MKLSKLAISLVFISLLIALSFFLITQNHRKLQPTSSSLPTQQNFLESYFKNTKDYEESFSKFSTMPKSKVLAVITNHHFLAKDLIAETFSGIDAAGIKTVIIVGPDHFNQLNGKHLAQTTDSRWQTPFGIVDPDGPTIEKILHNQEVYSDINLFYLEHGIYTLVPFVKKTLPEAKIVPLVLKQGNDYSSYYSLGVNVSKIIDQNSTVLIISSDFSHNVSVLKAKESDQKSVDLLPKKKIENVNSITNDCKQCTAFLFGYLSNATTDFKLLFNKNSFDICGENPGNVTSYVGAFFLPNNR